ncbi:MAG: glycosyltransferase family 2 protein [Bacteroidales bacterium]|nr:glycosyltransferase family 2 protein [Bacteroidales bacterium]
MPKISIVILNWNGRKYLEKFLPTVVKYSLDTAEVIVADNASSDDSVDYLKKNFTDIRIIQNNSNGGFAKGYNDALAQVEADYYILLNSDVEVTENWITPVIELMESNKNIASCQPKILSYHEPEKFEYAGAGGGFLDKYGYPFCRGRLFQTIEKDTGQFDDSIEIFWASGACMFIRADLFHNSGGLDNDFFAHMEEIDLCWRLKNEGYKIMYCPQSVVYHVGGGTLPKSSSRKTYFNFRNNSLLLYKNLPSKKLYKILIARLFLDGIAAFKFLLEGGWKDFYAVFRAHISFYKNFYKTRNKRKKLKQNQVSEIYNSNIAVDYFIRKIKHFSDLDHLKFSK